MTDSKMPDQTSKAVSNLHLLHTNKERRVGEDQHFSPGVSPMRDPAFWNQFIEDYVPDALAIFGLDDVDAKLLRYRGNSPKSGSGS